MLDRQPTLVGERLELRPLCPDDWAALFAVASDPLIWEQHPEPDRCTEPVFRGFFAQALASGGALAVIDRRTGRIIGSSRFQPVHPETAELEIGWTFLARDYWGGSYNREMKRLMLQHAFTAVDRVVFVIGPDNRRSRRAMERIGGTLLRVDRDASGRDHVVYGLSKATFERLVTDWGHEDRTTSG